MDVLKKELVKQFLKETKYLISKGNYEIVNRDKTFRTMALLGIDFETIKEIILSLTPKDYFNGPDEDRDRPEEFIWEFGKIFDSREIYIKLKIEDTGDKELGKCLSFHVAEREIKYPFKVN